MISEMEATLSNYGIVKLRSASSTDQEWCKVYDLSVENYAYIVVTVDLRSLHNNTIRVSFEPYEYTGIIYDTDKYDLLLDNLIHEMRRLILR